MNLNLRTWSETPLHHSSLFLLLLCSVDVFDMKSLTRVPNAPNNVVVNR